MPDQEHKSNMAIVVLTCALLAAGAFILSGIALIVHFDQASTARSQQAHVWHVVICDIENAVIKTKTISTDKKLAAIRFYDNLLVRDVHTLPCDLTPEVTR